VYGIIMSTFGFSLRAYKVNYCKSDNYVIIAASAKGYDNVHK